MAADNLQQKTFSGVAWGFFEKFSFQALNFIQGVILARLLMPSDYGIVAMVAIFIGISRTLVDSGFASALIRKQDKDELDYSTVFDSNVLISIALAGILIISSGVIANFYNQPILKSIIIIISIQIILNAAITIQVVRLMAELQFKKISIINISATLATSAIAILMAAMGAGLWSLVYPSFINIVVRFALYWHYQHWFPGVRFSVAKFKNLFSFGSKLAITNLINTVYDNIYPIVIGKVFTAKDLGYYTRGLGYAQIPPVTFTSVLSNVTYPILSKIQDDDIRLHDAYIRMIRLSSYVIFPIMIGLAALAYPIVILMITAKWSNAVIFLQIMCFSLMWYPIQTINLQLLQVKGKSELFFKLEIYKKILGVFIMAISIPFGLEVMCWGSVLTSILCLVINTYYTKKLIDVGFLKQMKIIAPSFLYAASMGLLIYVLIQFVHSLWIKMLTGIVAGASFYWIISVITNSQDYRYLVQVLKMNVLNRNSSHHS